MKRAAALTVPLNTLSALIVKHKGNMAAMADELNISRGSMNKFIKATPRALDLVESQRQANVDFAEAKLLELCDGYKERAIFIGHYKGEIFSKRYTKKHKPDIAALQAYLRAQAADRGYASDGNAHVGITVDKITFVSAPPKMKIEADADAEEVES